MAKITAETNRAIILELVDEVMSLIKEHDGQMRFDVVKERINELLKEEQW